MNKVVILFTCVFVVFSAHAQSTSGIPVPARWKYLDGDEFNGSLKADHWKMYGKAITGQMGGTWVGYPADDLTEVKTDVDWLRVFVREKN